MKNIKFIFILIYTFTNTGNLFSQYIQGRVIDKNTQQPLSGASIKFGKRGIISNEKGEFRLYIPEKSSTTQPLKVSFIGYESIDIYLLSAKDFYTIMIQEKSNNLSEVVVNSNAKSIVDKAFRKINDNYPQRDFTTKGFLYEYNRFDRSNYIYVIEAFVKTNTKSYKTNAIPDIEVLQKKENIYYNLDTLSFVRWGGTPRLLDYFDFVHTKKAFINPDKNQNYQYSLIDIKNFNGKDIYVITFESNDRKEKGKLFIDYLSLAFVGAEYKLMNKKNLSEEDTSNFEVKIMYQENNQKWFLDNITYNRIAVHKLPLTSTLIKSELHLDYQCTEIDSTTSIQNIGYAKNIQKMDVLLDKKVPFDSTFWRNHERKEGSIDLEFEEFFTKHNSVNTPISNNISNDKQISFKHRAKKYLSKSLRFEIGVNSLYAGISSEYINLNYTEPNQLYTIRDSQKVQPFNNYGLFLGWSLLMPFNTNFAYKSVSNFPFSGINQNGFSLEVHKHLKTLIWQRELNISPMLGFDFFSLSKKFDEVKISTEIIKNYGLEGERVSPKLIKKYTNLTTGLRFSFELNRRKRIFFSIKYNYELSQGNKLNLNETDGFFLTRNSFTINQIPKESIMNNQTYPLTFQIGLAL